MRAYITEMLGTFILVFCGTGAIVIHDISNGGVGHIGIGLTFGAIVMVLIYALGHISGAHFNPAVSLSMTSLGLLEKKHLFPYILSQTLGAICASLCLKWLFPLHQNLGATLPAGSWQQSFVLEFLLTFILMLVILFTSQGKKEIQSFVGLCVGATVMLEAIFAGKICGASMNPIRSLAPALVSLHYNDLWIYMIAPFLGALVASFVWKVLQEES